MSSNSTDTRQIRKFGLMALLFFGCLCAIGFWRKQPIPIYLFGILSILGIGFILFPTTLRPIYGSWLKIAHFFGTLFTTASLTLAYYFVITPSALIKRLFGGPPLPLRPDKNLPSYWVNRAEPAQSRERFIKRY